MANMVASASRYTGRLRSDCGKELGDLRFEGPQVGFDDFEGSGRFGDVEVAVEGDLVADLRLVVINPSVRNVEQDFASRVDIESSPRATVSVSRSAVPCSERRCLKLTWVTGSRLRTRRSRLH